MPAWCFSFDWRTYRCRVWNADFHSAKLFSWWKATFLNTCIWRWNIIWAWPQKVISLYWFWYTTWVWHSNHARLSFAWLEISTTDCKSHGRLKMLLLIRYRFSCKNCSSQAWIFVGSQSSPQTPVCTQLKRPLFQSGSQGRMFSIPGLQKFHNLGVN